MSDPKGHLSDPAVEDFPLNQSSTSAEFADILSDTFKAWLEDLKPWLEPDNNPGPAQPTVDDAQPPGELRFEGTLRVEGYAAGRLRSLTGTLILGEGSDVESDIVVATVIIDGALHGNIHATERVELQSHAQVTGNIESPTLAIQPGAVFEGQCHFLPSPFQSASGDSNCEESQQTSPGHASLTGSQDFASGPDLAEAEVVGRPFAAVAAVS